MATDKRERQRANRQQKYEEQAKQQRRDTTKRTAIKVVAGVVGLFAVVLVLAWLGGAFDGDDSETAGETLPNGFQLGTGECPPEDGVDEPVRSFTVAPRLCIDLDADYTATIATSEGNIVVDLDPAEQPGTVNNFVTLARYGYYDDTLLFRVAPSIDAVQGGGLTNTDNPGYNIPDEGDDFSYTEGDLVMARSEGADSAGGQWFFVTGPNGVNLDADSGAPGGGTYVPFGRVTSGLDIVQEMIAAADPASEVPTEEVRIETVTITEGAAPSTAATEVTGAAATTATTEG